MEKTVVFKTATFGGYNKNEVNQYLETLHFELDELENDVEVARKKAREINNLYEQSQAEVASLKEELETAKETLETSKNEAAAELKKATDAMVANREATKEVLESNKLAADQALESAHALLAETKSDLQKAAEEVTTTKEELNSCMVRLSEKENELSAINQDMEDLHEAKELIISLQMEAHANAKRITNAAEEEVKQRLLALDTETQQRIADADQEAQELLDAAKKNIQLLEETYQQKTADGLARLLAFQEHFNSFTSSLDVECEAMNTLVQELCPTNCDEELSADEILD